VDNHLDCHPSVIQPGGTGIAVFNRLAHHAQKAGDNPSRLGWWSWIHLKGKGKQITRIIVVYQPCTFDGLLLTYQQHCHGLATQGCSKCPHKVLLTNLAQELRSWQDEGNCVIILTDFNEDV